MKMKTLGLVAATLIAPMGAQAATVTGSFDVTAAVSERADALPYSLWFETVLSAGLSTVFTMSEPGLFVADAVGATLTGSVMNLLDSNAGFDIAYQFDRDFSDNLVTVPEFKAVWADVFEHGNEDYFDLERATVTGTGGFEGLNFSLVRNPPDGRYVTQVGGGELNVIGANQHNSNFGMSGWSSIASVAVNMTTCTLCTFDESFYTGLVHTQSDINVDLTPIAVPLPGAGLLLFGALVGAGGMARRRKA